MMIEQRLAQSKRHTLADDDIQIRSLPDAAGELPAATAIRAGRHGPVCWADTKSETIACCHAIPDSEAYQIVPASNGEWYCNYADSGTGDWD